MEKLREEGKGKIDMGWEGIEGRDREGEDRKEWREGKA